MGVKLTNLQKHLRERFISSAASEKIGAGKTIERLKAMGLPIRRQDGLRKYKEYAKLPGREDIIKYVGKQKTIGRELYTNQEGFMRRRYRYVVRYQTYNKASGERQWFRTALTSNTEKLPWQIEQIAEQAVATGMDKSPFDVLSLYVAEAHHRSGDTWQ